MLFRLISPFPALFVQIMLYDTSKPQYNSFLSTKVIGCNHADAKPAGASSPPRFGAVALLVVLACDVPRLCYLLRCLHTA